MVDYYSTEILLFIASVFKLGHYGVKRQFII